MLIRILEPLDDSRDLVTVRDIKSRVLGVLSLDTFSGSEMDERANIYAKLWNGEAVTVVIQEAPDDSR